MCHTWVATSARAFQIQNAQTCLARSSFRQHPHSPQPSPRHTTLLYAIAATKSIEPKINSEQLADRFNMFYSHEILTSRKNGFATVWLVATLGSHVKKVSRKAILDVDVSRTCDTILEPSVPLALRLQSNLLYGVVKIFAQQCQYVLANVESARNYMRMVSKAINKPAGLLGEAANTSTRLLLEDDPSFLPELEFGLFDMPFDNEPFSNLAFGNSLPDDFLRSNVIPSDRPSLGSDLKLASTQSVSPQIASYEIVHAAPGQEKAEQEGLQDDLGLTFDLDGDTAMLDAPLLQDDPPLLADVAEDYDPLTDPGRPEILPRQSDLAYDPAQETFPDVTEQKGELLQFSEGANAQLQAKSSRRRVVPLDAAIELSNGRLKSWQDDYVQNMQQDLVRKKSAAQGLAQENAQHWMFHQPAILHAALAIFDTQTIVYGTTVNVADAKASSSEGHNTDQLRPMDRDIYVADQNEVEYGREQPTPLNDLHQSSLVPWNSSVSHHRQPSTQIAASYLGSRARFSSMNAPEEHQSQPFDTRPADEFQDHVVPMVDDLIDPTSESQWLRDALIAESKNFLAFVQDNILQSGDGRTTLNRMLPPAAHTVATAAQALLHVLTLATQDLISVNQAHAFADITIDIM